MSMDHELLTNLCVAALGVDGEITDEEIEKIVEVLAEFDITEDDISDAIDDIEDFDTGAGIDQFSEMDKSDQKKIIQVLKKIFSSDGINRGETQLVSSLQKISDATG
jgi:uncharacterized tellurite resistance protein B-like protein